MSASEPPTRMVDRIDRQRIVMALTAAAVVALVIWLVVRGNGDPAQPTGTGPIAVTVEELRDLAADRDQPIYWLGERPDRTYEWAETADGNVYIRYLPPGTDVGDESELYLTVGTYPAVDGYAATQSAAEADGAIRETGPGGALVVTNEQRPTSVYVAYPGVQVQIEVYHPDAQRAMEEATSGEVEPVR